MILITNIQAKYMEIGKLSNKIYENDFTKVRKEQFVHKEIQQVDKVTFTGSYLTFQKIL